jgi:hypothetical protein
MKLNNHCGSVNEISADSHSFFSCYGRNDSRWMVFEFDPFLLRLQSVQFSVILVTQLDIESMVHEIFYFVF